ncbi:hypothetical protein ES703_12906 [subsurface metagenome]
MKAVNLLLDKIIVPILLAFLIPVVTGIGSKASTGNWLEWFTSIPSQVWITLAIIIALWILVIAIRYRIKHLRKEGHSPISIISVPYGDWRNVGKLKYADVIWIVRAPAPPWYELDPKPITPDDLDVDTPPRCPKCETEIEQTQSFWGGYIWKCVKCGFKKRNSESYYREEERVKKIARRDFEMYQSQAKQRQ